MAGVSDSYKMNQASTFMSLAQPARIVRKAKLTQDEFVEEYLLTL